jgi:hypothetical protein
MSIVGRISLGDESDDHYDPHHHDSPPTEPTTPGGVTGPSVVLSGNGASGVAFGETQGAATTGLTRLFGDPPTTASLGQGCTGGVAEQWPQFTAVFSDGSFVGYRTSGPNATTEPGIAFTTSSGLRVGDTLARAEALYGAAWSTSAAQGGSWSATTPLGPLEGNLSDLPNHVPPPRITSIDAGTLDCPTETP